MPEGKTYDLDRVVFPEDTEWEGACFQAGMTVRDVIRQMSGIGYGGHFSEASDDELAVYLAIAKTPNEYRWMIATREAYCELLEHFVRENSHVPKVWIT